MDKEYIERDAAIDAIKKACNPNTARAILCINALNSVPRANVVEVVDGSVESGGCISRKSVYQFAKYQLEKETGAYSKGRNDGLKVIMSAVMNNECIHSSDVAEIVRCKDCKYTKKDGGEPPAIYCEKWDRWEMPEDAYCYLGRKK